MTTTPLKAASTRIGFATHERLGSVTPRLGASAGPLTGLAASASEEREFQEAMTAYKQRSGRLFPTWSEVLEVLQSLGYEKPTSAPGSPPEETNEPAKVCHVQLAVELVEDEAQVSEIEQLGMAGIVEAVGQALKHGVARNVGSSQVVELEEAALSLRDAGDGQSNLKMSAMIEVRFH